MGCRVSVSPQGGERHKFPNPNPFVEEDIDKSEVASVAYRWVLTPAALSLLLSHYCSLSTADHLISQTI